MMRLSGAPAAIFVNACLLALMIPIVAAASSYWSSLAFSYELKGQTRSYDGSTMRISMTARADKTQISTFRVRLYRDRPWPMADDYIGGVDFPRNGSKYAAWSNVGNGKYFYYFSKANDGIWVFSDNVHMYN